MGPSVSFLYFSVVGEDRAVDGHADVTLLSLGLYGGDKTGLEFLF